MYTTLLSEWPQKVMIRPVDTDVVLATAIFYALGLDKLWIAFKVKNYYSNRVISAHNIAINLGERARARPFFHAVSTKVDVTQLHSPVLGKTTWDISAALPAHLWVCLEKTAGITDENLCHLERFVILLFWQDQWLDARRYRKKMPVC